MILVIGGRSKIGAALLVTAMSGVGRVFLLSSPRPDAVTWHRNAVDAARRTEVQLLVRMMT